MKPIFRKTFHSLAAISALSLTLTQTASAHCDAMDGPVITEAQRALASGDVTTLLRWVPAADEGQVREVFDKAVRVRKLGSEAREFADRQFFTTLVEVHRASEGAPFTGIKEAGHINPSVSAADAGLAAGNVDALVARTTGEVEQGIRQRFDAVIAAKAHAEDSVPQGREFVSRYVQYVHYVEGLHAAMSATDEHAAADTEAATEAHAH